MVACEGVTVVFSPAEFLAKDMTIILKNDKNLWNRMAGGRLGEIAGVTWSNEESSTINTDDEHLASKNGKGFMSVMAPNLALWRKNELKRPTYGLVTQQSGRLHTNLKRLLLKSNLTMRDQGAKPRFDIC